MQEQPAAIWQDWHERLKSLEIHEVVAAVLEAGGPLSLIGAQLVYFGQPLLRGFVPDEKLHALASLLEDREALQIFIHHLREVEA